MGIQENENSFFTCYLKVVLDDSISHYYWKVWKLEKMYGWYFWRPNDSIKSKRNAFSGHKQDRLIKVFTDKQETSKGPLTFLNVKNLKEVKEGCL